jgi:hypothetical protein
MITTEVFDTYTKRTAAYYILLLILIIPIVLLVLANMSVFPLSEQNLRYLGFSAAIGLAVYFALNNSFLKMYIKAGEISISDNFININSLKIHLYEIDKIVISANDYKGKQKGTSDGSGNRVQLYFKDNITQDIRFVIKSGSQRDALQIILKKVAESGVNVTGNGF